MRLEVCAPEGPHLQLGHVCGGDAFEDAPGAPQGHRVVRMAHRHTAAGEEAVDARQLRGVAGCPGEGRGVEVAGEDEGRTLGKVLELARKEEGLEQLQVRVLRVPEQMRGGHAELCGRGAAPETQGDSQAQLLLQLAQSAAASPLAPLRAPSGKRCAVVSRRRKGWVAATSKCEVRTNVAQPSRAGSSSLRNSAAHSKSSPRTR
mmetsp:Transcript_64435/g.199576  ORF Transcript_64435/g.199576 Transcript_64435/m.199576 type:complete len:204 (+) Transcript_64435:300-911(+)